MKSLKNLNIYRVLSANHGSQLRLGTAIGVSFEGSKRSRSSLRRPLIRFSNLICQKYDF